VKTERLPKFRKLPCAFCGHVTNLGVWARRDGGLQMVPCCKGCEETPLPFTMPERTTPDGTYLAYTITAAEPLLTSGPPHDNCDCSRCLPGSY
jgi:hypothetical protein